MPFLWPQGALSVHGHLGRPGGLWCCASSLRCACLAPSGYRSLTPTRPGGRCALRLRLARPAGSTGCGRGFTHRGHWPGHLWQSLHSVPVGSAQMRRPALHCVSLCANEPGQPPLPRRLGPPLGGLPCWVQQDRKTRRARVSRAKLECWGSWVQASCPPPAGGSLAGGGTPWPLWEGKALPPLPSQRHPPPICWPMRKAWAVPGVRLVSWLWRGGRVDLVQYRLRFAYMPLRVMKKRRNKFKYRLTVK